METEEALEIIIKEVKLLDSELCDLMSSLHRVLAEDIYAKDNLPPFDKSAMDGYAVKSDDGLMLKSTQVVKAGDKFTEELKHGETYKIMTGAPIPAGADAVVKKEDTEVDGEMVSLIKPVKKGQNILKAGEEIRHGDLALEKGKVIRPAEIGLLASLGYSKIKVYGKPKVALLITGDELVDVYEILTSGKIRNCNEYTLHAMLSELNADVISYGIIRDDPEKVDKKMSEAFENADIVISSGGSSSGDYDFISTILERKGGDIKFSATDTKSLKIIFATKQQKLYFGLPGNPLSVISKFEQFVKPAIKKMMGRTDLLEEDFPVTLAEDFKCRPGRVNYIYVSLEKRNGTYYAHYSGSQKTHALKTICRSNGLVILEGSSSIAKAGEIVRGKFIFD